MSNPINLSSMDTARFGQTGGLQAMQVASNFRSHPGNKRDRNEDAFLDCPQAALWAVADGMGGHAAGDLASRVVVESLGRVSAAISIEQQAQAIADAITFASRSLHQTSQSDYPGNTIGSTVAILGVVGTIGHVLWAGDSRIYLWRDGLLMRLTHDHSQAQELIDSGAIEEGSREHERIANIITRAVGVQEHVVLDQYVFEVQEGDVFLLCSDGLNREMSDPEIAAQLSAGSGRSDATTFVDMCLERGARDNVTVGLVEIGSLPAR